MVPRLHFDLDLSGLKGWKSIEELGLLAHTVKHAEGRSAEKLRAVRPDLFRSPITNKMDSPTPDYDLWPPKLPLSGEDIYVTEEIFSEYATAAYDFVLAIVNHFRKHGATVYPCGSGAAAYRLL